MLEQYKELKSVYKDDQATMYYENSTYGVEDTYEIWETSEASLTNSLSMQASGHQKRSHYLGEKALSKIEDLTTQVSNLVKSISTVDQ